MKTSPLEYLVAGCLLTLYGWLPIAETQPVFLVWAPWWIEFILYPPLATIAIYLYDQKEEKILALLKRLLPRPLRRFLSGFSFPEC